jgi:hypothetical protein
VKHQHPDRHETSLDTGTKGKKVMATIKELFRRQDKKKSDNEDNALEKEIRLFKQKQHKVKWKETKNHHQRLKWAKEILEEDVIPPALAEVRKGIENVVSSILDDLTPTVIEEVEKRASLRLERLDRVEQRRSLLLAKLERKKKAEEQRITLMEKLEATWRSLEAGNLSMSTGWVTLSSPVQKVGKRKRNYEEDIHSRRMAEQATKNIITTILESVSSQHDCGYSTACPAWFCEMICERKELDIEIDNLSEQIKQLEIEEQSMEEICTSGRIPTILILTETGRKTDDLLPNGWKASQSVSPVKELVKQFEKLSSTIQIYEPKQTSKNTSTWNMLSVGIETQQEVANPKVNFDEMRTKVLPGSQDKYSNKLENLENISLTKSKAATQPKTIPSSGKQKKKKVWAKLKSGLFGWRVANVKTVSKVQEEKINTHFCKYQPLTAAVGEGSGENVSQTKMAEESELYFSKPFSKYKHTECNNEIRREYCHSELDLPGLESVDLTKMMDS